MLVFIQFNYTVFGSLAMPLWHLGVFFPLKESKIFGLFVKSFCQFVFCHFGKVSAQFRSQGLGLVCNEFLYFSSGKQIWVGSLKPNLLLGGLYLYESLWMCISVVGPEFQSSSTYVFSNSIPSGRNFIDSHKGFVFAF